MTMVAKMAAVDASAGSRLRAARAVAARATARWALAALLAVGPGAALAQDAAPTGDVQRGAKLAYTCYGCHGIVDYRNAYPNFHVPKLGGQHAAYIAAALKEYRTGARKHPTMVAQAMSMSDQDIADIAAYLETTAPVKSDGKTEGTAPAAAQVCVACHGTDGVGILPEYPTLTGQHRDYLEYALRAYRSGERQNAIMQGFAATLKDDDIRALAEYFSRQQPGLWTPRPPRAPEMRGTAAPNPPAPR
jgi:cytochrome c553